MTNVLQALNVRVVGIGSRYMVLAHGFGTDQSSWRQVLPYLTPDYRVVLFDLAFSGSVSPDFFDFSRYTTLDAYVDDLFLILDSLGITSCCYIGHSISAMIGILASIRRPSLFFKLILMGASPRYLNDDVKYEGGFEKEVIQSMFTAMESSYRGWVNDFAPLVIGADVPDAVTEFSQTLLNMRPDISLFVCRWVFDCDFRSILHMVKTRCLIIHTFKDFSVPISVVVYLNANLGGRTNIIMINTEGHIPYMSAPTLTGEALIRALTAP